MKKTNFDRYLDEQLKDPAFAARFKRALRRVADALHARVRIVFEPAKTGSGMRVAESAASYRAKRARTKRT